jgi:hypothetical protein
MLLCPGAGGERAGVYLVDRDAEAFDLPAEGARLVAALVGQRTLVGTVLEGGHARVVLAEVGRGVANPPLRSSST